MHSELRDAQVDHNKTSCQLETALVEKLESEGQLETVTKKYKRLKGQHEKALADLSSQQEQEQHNDALLDAEQPSTELADSRSFSPPLNSKQTKTQQALGKMRSIFSSSTSQTATHWTGTALRALLSTPQEPAAQPAWLVGTRL